MTYRNISFCLRSHKGYCKDNGNIPLCMNTDCFCHHCKIPRDLPERELIRWADMAHMCKFYRTHLGVKL